MSQPPVAPSERSLDQLRRTQILEASFAVASRRGLDGLTIRRVASKAGMSHGLVHHYFQNKETLLRGLLEWLLDTMEHPIPDSMDVAQTPSFPAAVEKAMERAFANRDRIDLFFDFWVMGLRHPEIRSRFRQELARYRQRFVDFAERAAEASACSPGRVSAQGLAALAVAIIHGFAVQGAVDPEGFDVEGVRDALRALFERVETVPS